MKRNTRFLAITATAVFSIAVGSTYFTTDAIGSDSSKLGFESAIAGLDVSFENYYKAGNDVSDKEQVDEAIEEAVRVDEEAKAIEEEIAKQLEEAQKAEDEALANKAAWEAKMQGADEKAESIIKEATALADRRGEKIIEEAKEKADVIVRGAQAEAALERKKATEGIKREIVDVSSCLSEKILEREIKTEDHKKLIDSFISEIGEGDE